MIKHACGIAAAVLLSISPSHALQRTDTEFEIFQFPADMIPRIDGQTDDWAMVPDRYAYGTDQLSDTVKGNLTNYDPEDLDVTVRVGWVKGLNRLYFLYEAYDDYWNMYYKYGDLFEVAIDADRSGGPNIANPQIDDPWESHFLFKGVHAQNYHMFTPPGEGRDWGFVWGNQPWIGRLPYANHAYSYDFEEGESGDLVMEFWITPFDYAPYDGPERAVVSKLEENGLIALSWSILDFDEDHTEYEVGTHVGSTSEENQGYHQKQRFDAHRQRHILPQAEAHLVTHPEDRKIRNMHEEIREPVGQHRSAQNPGRSRPFAFSLSPRIDRPHNDRPRDRSDEAVTVGHMVEIEGIRFCETGHNAYLLDPEKDEHRPQYIHKLYRQKQHPQRDPAIHLLEHKTGCVVSYPHVVSSPRFTH